MTELTQQEQDDILSDISIGISFSSSVIHTAASQIVKTPAATAGLAFNDFILSGSMNLAAEKGDIYKAGYISTLGAIGSFLGGRFAGPIGAGAGGYLLSQTANEWVDFLETNPTAIEYRIVMEIAPEKLPGVVLDDLGHFLEKNVYDNISSSIGDVGQIFSSETDGLNFIDQDNDILDGTVNAIKLSNGETRYIAKESTGARVLTNPSTEPDFPVEGMRL